MHELTAVTDTRTVNSQSQMWEELGALPFAAELLSMDRFWKKGSFSEPKYHPQLLPRGEPVKLHWISPNPESQGTAPVKLKWVTRQNKKTKV